MIKLCDKRRADEDNTKLIQTDFDFPAIASVFGWNIKSVQVQGAAYYGVPCEHSGTDGTVRCEQCGLNATSFITAARAWIDDNDGAQAEDPGYF